MPCSQRPTRPTPHDATKLSRRGRWREEACVLTGADRRRGARAGGDGLIFPNGLGRDSSADGQRRIPESIDAVATQIWVPIYKNILRQCYDYLTIMPKLRSTYDERVIYKTSYEGRKASLRYDSLAKL